MGRRVMLVQEQGEDVATRAKKLISQGEHQDAIELLEAWLGDHPHDSRAWTALAGVYFKLANWQEAERAARRLVCLRGDSAREWCNLGIILRKLDELEEARRAQRLALQIDPSYERAEAELRKLDILQPEIVLTDQRLHCPKCGATAYLGDQYCLQCGAKLAGRMSTQRRGEADDARAEDAEVDDAKADDAKADDAKPDDAKPDDAKPDDAEARRPRNRRVRVEIGSWMAEALKLVTRDIWTHILATLVIGTALLLSSVVAIGPLVLSGPFICGYSYMLVMQMRRPTRQAEAGDLREMWPVFGQGLLAWVILSLAGVVLGIVVWIPTSLVTLLVLGISFESDPDLANPLVLQLPGLVFWMLFLLGTSSLHTLSLFVFLLIADGGNDFSAAIQESVRTVLARFWRFWWFVVALDVVLFVGAVTLVGWLLTTPIVLAATAVAYRDAFGIEGTRATAASD